MERFEFRSFLFLNGKEFRQRIVERIKADSGTNRFFIEL